MPMRTLSGSSMIDFQNSMPRAARANSETVNMPPVLEKPAVADKHATNRVRADSGLLLLSGALSLAAQQDAELDEAEALDEPQEVNESVDSARDIPEDGATKDEPKAVEPVTHNTRLSLLKEMFADCAVRDVSGAPQDFIMSSFLEACDLYRDILSKLGRAASVILVEIDDKIGGTRKSYLEAPEQRKTMNSFLARPHSGHDNLMWLLRGLEFFLTMIQLIFTGDGSGAAVAAYEKTLMQYHGWAVQMGVKVAMRAMPGKDTICQSEGLCLGNPSPERCRELCSQDAGPCSAFCLEQVGFMVGLMKKSGRWQTNKA